MSPAATSSTLTLTPHPAEGTPPGIEVVANYLLEGNQLMLDYRICGAINQLNLPPVATPRRVDGLWKHSCLEAFVREGSGPAYQEYNFSPSGEWACYQFTEYRGQPEQPACEAPSVKLHTEANGMSINCRISLPSSRPIHIGLCAVLEDQLGALSYWALHHPAQKADFHHPDAFVLEVK